jgi:hypothetical protein
MFHGVSVKLCVWNCSIVHQYYKLSLPSCPLFTVTAKKRHMLQTVTSGRYNIFCEAHWHKDSAIFLSQIGPSFLLTPLKAAVDEWTPCAFVMQVYSSSSHQHKNLRLCFLILQTFNCNVNQVLYP